MKMGANLKILKPLMLLLLCLAVGVVAFTQIVVAINTPKQVYGTVKNSNDSTPADSDVTFKAYISVRPNEQLTQDSTGCAFGSGYYQVELSTFPTQWAGGNILVVEFTNKVNGEKKTINVTLDNTANPQQVNVILQPKVLQSITITAPKNSFPVGESLQFTATGRYDDNSTEDITATAIWTVVPTPAGAAVFDPTVKGRLNGLKEGTGTVKASQAGVDSPTVSGTVTAFDGTVTVAANPTSIIANGTSTSAITATVKTSGGANVVDGVSVAFARSAGTGAVAPATATTVSGVANATYTSSTTVGSGTVTATVGAKSGNATVTLTHGPAAKINLTANPTLISSTTASESTLTARILDAFDNLVTTGEGATTAVTFGVTATTFGDIKPGFVTVNAVAGVATSYVVSKVDPTGGVINCTASAAGLTQGTVNVTTQPRILQSILIETTTGGKVNTTTPKVGETVQFKATGTYQDPATGAITTEVITDKVTWVSSDLTKGDFSACAGRFFAKAVGTTNVTATLGGKTSNAVAMNVQAANPVKIDATNLPTTVSANGQIDVGAATSGGTGDGFNYTIEAGSPAGGAITAAGVFTAGPNAGEYTIKATDKTSGASTTYKVKQAFTVTPTSWNFKANDPAKTFTIAGATAQTKYVWDIMETQTAATPVTTPADYGTWSNGREVTNIATKTNNFTPKADVTAIKTFFVRVTVDDPALIAAGLDKVTVGPFNVVPVAVFTIKVTDTANAKVAGAEVAVEFPKGVVTIKQTDANGEVTFNHLPDTGGNYAYQVKKAGYVTQIKTSNLKTVPVVLVLSDLTITGSVQTTGGVALEGATVTAYLPATPAVQYEARTAADGTYTVQLPKGAATTGWTVTASMPNYLSKQKTGIALTGGTAAVNFTGADGLAIKGLGSPDVDAGGGEKALTASGQTVEVDVPTGGLAVNAFIAIAQTGKTKTSNFTAASPQFVHEIKMTTDQAGTTPVNAADIKRIIITLPMDLSVVKPGDLEKGAYVIYKAETLAKLEAGEVYAIPAANILATDYIGDGKIGSVTFWIDRLSVFGVGAAVGGGVEGESTSKSGCFIATAAYGSYLDRHVELLRNFRDAYLLTNDIGKAFVNFYYSYSPPVADFIAKHDILRAAVRLALAPAVMVSYVALNTTPIEKSLIFILLTGMIVGTFIIVRRVRRARVNC